MVAWSWSPDAVFVASFRGLAFRWHRFFSYEIACYLCSLPRRRPQRTRPTFESSALALVILKEAQIRHHVLTHELLLNCVKLSELVHGPPSPRVDIQSVHRLVGLLSRLERHNFIVVSMAIHDELCPTFLEGRFVQRVGEKASGMSAGLRAEPHDYVAQACQRQFAGDLKTKLDRSRASKRPRLHEIHAQELVHECIPHQRVERMTSRMSPSRTNSTCSSGTYLSSSRQDASYARSRSLARKALNAPVLIVSPDVPSVR